MTKNKAKAEFIKFWRFSKWYAPKIRRKTRRRLLRQIVNFYAHYMGGWLFLALLWGFRMLVYFLSFGKIVLKDKEN
jgi:hypothetical protein